jgi:hypothetical protein
MSKIKKNPFEQSEIYFEDSIHTYFERKTGQTLISVSQLISKYVEPFDPNGHILRACSKKEGITPEELKSRWDKKRDLSCVRGKSWHEQIEHFLLTGKILEASDKDIVEKVKNKIKFEGQVYPEVLVYNLDYMVAGMADIVEYFPFTNELIVKDWKSNATLEKPTYGKKLLYPLNHLDQSKKIIYALQLSLYSYLLKLKGFEVRADLQIFWINDKIRDIEIIKIPYLENEIITLLKHYHNSS